jgi:lipopolysaccharide/colanic/teichoic acid biosynthesis glycosyltransferase
MFVTSIIATGFLFLLTPATGREGMTYFCVTLGLIFAFQSVTKIFINPTTFATFNKITQHYVSHVLSLSFLMVFVSSQYSLFVWKWVFFILLTPVISLIFLKKERLQNLAPSMRLFPQVTSSKRRKILDLILAPLLFLALLPLMALIALLVVVVDRRHPIFCQERVGLNGLHFKIYKFQSLDPKSLQPSTLGAFLRNSNFDELPQLWNVIKGDLSLVGPRPELPQKAQHFSPLQNQRNLVRPGITGFWQLSQYRSKPIIDNVEFDLLYIAQQNFWVDLATLLATPFLMVQINQPKDYIRLKDAS